MKIKTLSKSDIKQLNNEILSIYGIEPLTKKDNVLVEEHEDGLKLIRVNGKYSYFLHDGKPVPTLKAEPGFLKRITVDMGAVRFLCSGADLMRPGIVDIEDGIKAGDIVGVIDTDNRKMLMIGCAILDSDAMREQKSGKSATSLHYAGDRIWKKT
ncbi:RNA-binding protein [Candidatus Woesearchaeota archaeon]|nr:RNA-binding protein [Candidatus Woesearchaeota archaeon]